MSLYVLKFGGSSVATTTRMKHIVEIVASFIREKHQVVVVTSAMQGVTNQLIELTGSFSTSPINREYDTVISTGEQVAAGLLAMALNAERIPAQSMTSWQIPIYVQGDYSDAEITKVSTEKIFKLLKKGIIPVITGFQGISENSDIYTIGRGGSDATACAVAKAIDADECLIYTDVDGVYTADPRVVLNARRLDEVSYDDMIELASWGAKVLQTKSTQIAKDYGVKLKVLSSFAEGNGTKIIHHTKYAPSTQVTGIAHSLDCFAVYFSSDNFKQLLQPFSLMIRDYADIILIAKTLQTEIQTIISDNSVDAKIDNDIGTVTVVCRDPDFVHDILLKNRIYDKHEIKHTLIHERSMTFVVTYQQTIPLMTELHEHCIIKYP